VALLLAALVLLAYGGAGACGFVFDDLPAVRDNAGIQAGDFWQAAFGVEHSPISNRPLTCLTLVGNRALGGMNPGGFHWGNVALHLANVWLLLAVVRRTLRAPNLRGAFTERRAFWPSRSAWPARRRWRAPRS
jgi:hypothetical protein